MNSGQFTSERSRGNQHAKGNPPNATTFKKGIDTMERSKSWRGGIQNNKKDGIYIAISTNKRVRRSRMIYEQHHGPIPSGMIIWHIDHDRYNDDISNLEAITRGECAKRNKFKS